jgi:hypothetical protein
MRAQQIARGEKPRYTTIREIFAQKRIGIFGWLIVDLTQDETGRMSARGKRSDLPSPLQSGEMKKTSPLSLHLFMACI